MNVSRSYVSYSTRGDLGLITFEDADNMNAYAPWLRTGLQSLVYFEESGRIRYLSIMFLFKSVPIPTVTYLKYLNMFPLIYYLCSI